ncbi:MAG: ATP-binding protein [Pseudomonadota bacterium]
MREGEDAGPGEESVVSGILNTLPSIYYMVDERGEIVRWNQRSCEVSGYGNDEYRGMNVLVLIDPKDHQRVIEGMAKVLTEGQASVEADLVTKDGRRIPHLFSGKRIVVDGKPYLSGLGLDLSDLRAALAVANEARERAELAARAKSDFLAMMSHESRTPMNGILGMARLLADTPLDETQRDWLETISSSGAALLTILNDILDFSKLEAGKLTVERVAFDLRALVSRTLGLIQPKAEEKGLELSLDTADGVPQWAFGDPTRLRQILLNLLGNAVKFTNRGRVTLRVVATGPSVSFTVEDTGIGITPDQMSHLFTPFSQADGSISRRFGGTGLGLAICRRLAEVLGGTLTVTSAPGRGSAFTLDIPMPMAEPAPPVAEEVPILPPLSILLAEDNPVNQKVAKASLVRLGHRVTVAEDGLEAARLGETAPPGHFDLVLMDMQMPRCGGLEATANIRALADPARARLPIVAMTANAMKEDAERCLAAGMNGYISKPVAPAELMRCIARALSAAGDG